VPLFSVIIPSFNRAALLISTINSVAAQRFANFEIIVVDDGSTDRTHELLKPFRERLLVLCQANRGPGAARNLGARHARGTYLAFLDSDDLWFPWTLDTYRDVILKHGAPSFVAGRPYLFSDPSELDKVKNNSIQTAQFEDYLASGDQWRWWGVSSFVIRQDAFEAANGFAEDWINGEDADLALRLGVAPGFVQVLAPATFAYREHEASAKSDFDRTVAGARSSVLAERGGRYPGGRARARARRRILTRHIRPIVLTCLKRGLRRDAWELYIATLGWNISVGRFKYLAGFLLLAAMIKGRCPKRSKAAVFDQ
jgi:glycosyltransferase involved in cell wall biosynthesis